MARLTADRRPGLDPPAELTALRKMSAGAGERFPRHPATEADYQDFGGVRCLVLRPASVKGQILYFHGGGFRIGSPEIPAGFASHLAARTSCQIVMPFYSLAPEGPFPAALLDGQAVLEALPESEPLFVGGDSAGGNLAAVLARRFATRIRALLLISPWLDLRVTATSYRTNRELDTVFSEDSARTAAALYLQGHSSLDPDVSPLLGDLSGMPPSLAVVGDPEVLLDDSLAFAEQLRNADRTVSLQVIPGMSHVEPTLTPGGTNTEEVINLLSHFVAERLKRRSHRV